MNDVALHTVASPEQMSWPDVAGLVVVFAFLFGVLWLFEKHDR